MNNPISYIVSEYLNKAGHNINNDELELQLLSHPDFPNLIAVSDLFNHFKIEHVALEIPRNVMSLTNLPDYFLAHINDPKIGEQLALVIKKNNQVILHTDRNDKRTISNDEFIKIWSGIIISLEEIATYEWTSKIKSIGSFHNVVLASLIFISVAIFIISSPSWFNAIFFGLSIVGMLISIFIIKQELGSGSSTLNKFCSGSEKTSCEAVINSKGASFLGILKLSDIGLIYFCTQILILVLSTINSDHYDTLFVIASTLSVPFMGYSLIYQWKVVKKWCPLCLGVLAVLFLQFSTTFAYFPYFHLSIPPTGVWLMSIFGLLIVSSFWLFTRPLLVKQKDLKVLEFNNLKFKRNFKFFKTSLLDSEPIQKTDLEDGIILGNPEAQLEIVFITNPLCYYCKDAHEVIDNVLSTYADDLKVNIRFNVQANDAQNQGTLIAHHLIHIYRQEGSEKCIEAINKVYALNDEAERNKWLEANKTVIDQNIIDLLHLQKVWGINEKAYLTPTLLINNYTFPRTDYLIDDLPYFIDDLLHQEYSTLQLELVS